MAYALRQLPLRSLDVSGCKAVQDLSFAGLPHECPTLESLNFTYVNGVTDECCARLRAECVLLVFRDYYDQPMGALCADSE